MPKKKRVKKIITHSFDKFATSDYSGAVDDNLNPKRNMEYETQVEDLTKAVIAKLDVVKGHIRSRLESQDFDTTSTLSEGGDSGIDDLVNSLVTGGNGKGHKYPGITGPSWLEREIDTLLAYTIASGSPQLKSIFDNFDLQYINCYGVDTIDGGYDYSETSDDDDDGTNNNGSSLNADGSSASADDGNGDGDTGGDGSNGGPPWSISYTVENGTNSSANPSTYTADFLPLYIEEPTPNTDYKFKGWYYDSSYATKLISNVITSGHTGDLSLYAKIVNASEDDDEDDGDTWQDDSGSFDDNDFDEDDYEKACDIADLLILKIIAMIIKIIASLIKVISLVLAILIPLAEILQLATICWIDPPVIGKIINQLMQKAMSMVMKIIGVLLQKLWSMLGLECISDSMMSLIDQVNEALSGISGIMLAISDAAADLSSGFDLAKTIREAVISAVDSAKDQLKDLTPSKVIKDQMQSAAQAAKKGWGDIVDQFTDPDTYLDLAPEEAKDTIEGLVTGVKTTQKLAKSLQQTAAAMTGAFKGLGDSAKAAVDEFKAKD